MFNSIPSSLDEKSYSLSFVTLEKLSFYTYSIQVKLFRKYNSRHVRLLVQASSKPIEII